MCDFSVNFFLFFSLKDVLVHKSCLLLLFPTEAGLLLWKKVKFTIIASITTNEESNTFIHVKVESEHYKNSDPSPWADEPLIQMFPFSWESYCLVLLLCVTPSISQSVHPRITMLSVLAVCPSWANFLFQSNASKTFRLHVLTVRDCC